MVFLKPDGKWASSKVKKETQIEIAKQLLDTLDEETIGQKIGLTLEEVRQLKQEFSVG